VDDTTSRYLDPATGFIPRIAGSLVRVGRTRKNTEKPSGVRV
jgi:hypothetical protein